MLRGILKAPLIIAIEITWLLFTPFAASAQSQCDERANVISVLQQKYKESPIAIGVTHNGGLVEVLTTADGSTWSIIVTTPQGMACLIAAGEGWKAMVAAALGSDS